MNRKEQLQQELEDINNVYWATQAHLGQLVVARAEVMNQLKELDNV